MPSLPIVLAHGYFGFGVLGPLSYFNNVAKILAQIGAKEVFAADVAPKGGISERSAQLATQIRQHAPNTKVHVIAHSMGALDARFLIAKANGREIIASLTTLGAPFRGTIAADVVADPLKFKQIGAAPLLAAIARYELHAVAQWPFAVGAQTHFAINELRAAVQNLATGDYSHVVSYFNGVFSLDDDALRELTADNCKRMFPDDERDLEGVPAFSYAGSIQPASASPFFVASAILLDAVGQPGDALIPLNSAKLRNHRQTLPVDHSGLIGWSPTDVSDLYRQIYAALAP